MSEMKFGFVPNFKTARMDEIKGWFGAKYHYFKLASATEEVSIVTNPDLTAGEKTTITASGEARGYTVTDVA